MGFKLNREWERKVKQTSVRVPATATPKERAEALAKELKRRGLTK